MAIIINVNILMEVYFYMNKSKQMELMARAREMMIAGQTFDEIKSETNLRPKDLKKIQSEINSHF